MVSVRMQRFMTSWNNQKRSNAARIIQRVWKESVSNPKYKACRNRLLHEYDHMWSRQTKNKKTVFLNTTASSITTLWFPYLKSAWANCIIRTSLLSQWISCVMQLPSKVRLVVIKVSMGLVVILRVEFTRPSLSTEGRARHWLYTEKYVQSTELTVNTTHGIAGLTSTWLNVAYVWKWYQQKPKQPHCATMYFIRIVLKNGQKGIKHARYAGLHSLW